MLNQFLRSVVEAGHEWLQRDKIDIAGTGNDLNALCLNLFNVKGEASSAALAHDIVQSYESENTNDLGPFFDFLLSEFDLDPDLLIKAANNYKTARSPENLRILMTTSEARRQDLFRRINQARNGTAMLVDLRGRLLGRLPENPDWKRIDLDLRHLLSSWFNRGFLRVKRIDWHSPAIILEKIMRYEAVHKMHGWNDLRRRLADDRRCYAFFHPALPDEPLIFVEVALVQGLAASVGGILDKEAIISPADQQDTAIFYSINDCQIGLRGISFGDFLIKQVVAEIQKELPNITTFSTLSPIPGFQSWLAAELDDENCTILSPAAKTLLARLNEGDLEADSTILEQLEALLTALCAHYLLDAQEHGKPVDPVARFHLRNGAQLHRINWLGDLSENGMNQSFGMLVNYVYDIDTIEKNHEDYVHHGQISASDSIKKQTASLPKHVGIIDRENPVTDGAA